MRQIRQDMWQIQEKMILWTWNLKRKSNYWSGSVTTHCACAARWWQGSTSAWLTNLPRRAGTEVWTTRSGRMNSKLTHGSLFSGIGGPEIAAEMMGWKNVFHCEINPFGRKILDYWFPNSKSYEDITKTDFREWQGKINVLTGGFPCQPFSCADTDGRRSKKSGRTSWNT